MSNPIGEGGLEVSAHFKSEAKVIVKAVWSWLGLRPRMANRKETRAVWAQKGAGLLGSDLGLLPLKMKQNDTKIW